MVVHTAAEEWIAAKRGIAMFIGAWDGAKGNSCRVWISGKKVGRSRKLKVANGAK
jgi:hypothetical protein